MSTPFRWFRCLFTRCVALRLAMAMGVIISCSGCDSKEPETSSRPTIQTAGSTTLHKAVEALSQNYQTNPASSGLQITHNPGPGSGKGLAMLIADECQVARMSRDLKPEEVDQLNNSSQSVRVFTIAIDAVAVVVHPDRKQLLSSISLNQLKSIFFTGDTTQWSQLEPGLSGVIKPVCSAPSQSGTASTFREVVANSQASLSTNCRIISNGNDIIEYASKHPDAIGIVSLGLAKQSDVIALPITITDGMIAEADTQSIQRGYYPLTRNLNLCVRQPLQPAIADWLLYVLSPAGQSTLENEGFFPVR